MVDFRANVTNGEHSQVVRFSVQKGTEETRVNGIAVPAIIKDPYVNFKIIWF